MSESARGISISGAEISGKEFVDTHDTTMKDPADCWNYWGTHWSDGIQPGWAELERNLSLERPIGKILDIEPCRPELIKPEKAEVRGGGPAGKGKFGCTSAYQDTPEVRI